MKCKHVYIHFPFCVSKCPYCDFFSVASGDSVIHRTYIDHLLREIEIYDEHIDDNISTLYIGGGTPGLLGEVELDKIVSKFDFGQDSEITVEVNPGAISAEKLKSFRDIGINRLSIGSQSFIDRDLKTLGRRHFSKDIYSTFNNARKAGFENINLDLIIGIPGQTPASVIYNANEIIMLEPEHISTYVLTYYEDTVFGSMRNDGRITKIDDDIEMDFFDWTEEILGRSGYLRYEISNFSKKGYRSRHNLNTWDFGDYIGFGASAHSFYGGKRWSNPASVEKYYEIVRSGAAYFDDKVESEITELKKEFIFLGLRKLDGLDIIAYNKYFGADIMNDYGNKISQFIKNGTMVINNDFLKIRSGKLNIFNSIVSEIIY